MEVRCPVTAECPGSTPGVPAKSYFEYNPDGSKKCLVCPGVGDTPGVLGPKSDQSDWECNRCGACCSLVDCPHFLQTHWGDGGGVCGIYETRPAECRVPDILKKGAPGVVEFYCETCRFLAEQRKRWTHGR